MNSENPNHVELVLAAVVRLLDDAAQMSWAAADQDRLRSDWHYVGLGAVLARDTAMASLPDDAGVDCGPVGPAENLAELVELVDSARDLVSSIVDHDSTGDLGALVIVLDDLASDVASAVASHGRIDG